MRQLEASQRLAAARLLRESKKPAPTKDRLESSLGEAATASRTR